MAISYLLDEHIPLSYRTQIIQRKPELRVWAIGDPNAPAKGTSDPDLLVWCEKNGFVLITNNRKTMPNHLSDHLNTGHHLPEIFVVNENMSMGQIIGELILIAEASFEDEYQDRISFMPLL